MNSRLLKKASPQKSKLKKVITIALDDSNPERSIVPCHIMVMNVPVGMTAEGEPITPARSMMDLFDEMTGAPSVGEGDDYFSVMEKYTIEELDITDNDWSRYTAEMDKDPEFLRAFEQSSYAQEQLSDGAEDVKVQLAIYGWLYKHKGVRRICLTYL